MFWKGVLCAAADAPGKAYQRRGPSEGRAAASVSARGASQVRIVVAVSGFWVWDHRFDTFRI